jgi:hypothetical protein
MCAFNHKLAAEDGKRYAIEKGIWLGQRYIYLSMKGGCRCTSVGIIPGFEDS